MRKKIPNKVGDITKEGFVCLYGFIGTYIMRRMEERKIRISSNAEALNMQQSDPEIVWKDTHYIGLVLSDPTWIFGYPCQ